jgi:small GTP-binding protein
MDTPQQMLYKICIVGDGAVGKTTILHRYVDGKFVHDTMMTLGTNFFMKNIFLEDLGVDVRFQIWDLGGQEHFAAVRPSFYSGAKGLIYTYDLARPITFINLKNWKVEIENVLKKSISSVLIGNKLDLVKHVSKIMSKKELREMLLALNADKSFYTSAKTGDGIDDAFKYLARKIYLERANL